MRNFAFSPNNFSRTRVDLPTPRVGDCSPDARAAFSARATTGVRPRFPSFPSFAPIEEPVEEIEEIDLEEQRLLETLIEEQRLATGAQWFPAARGYVHDDRALVPVVHDPGPAAPAGPAGAAGDAPPARRPAVAAGQLREMLREMMRPAPAGVPPEELPAEQVADAPPARRPAVAVRKAKSENDF